jgi:ABC-2 type transport system ATP-binding protein
MLQEGGLYPAITPREALDLFAHFYPHPRKTEDLLRMVGLEDSSTTRYRRLSGGQKQRLALALALVGCPELVFLDEPTVGLDPHARRMTWETIGRLHEEGVTILLTTHYLEEAERLAGRVAIIHRGKLVAAGPPSSLLQSDASVVRLRSASPIDPQAIATLPSVRNVREIEPCVYLLDTDDAPSLLVEVTSRLRQEEVPILELRVGPSSLEDAFLQLTGEEASL